MGAWEYFIVGGVVIIGGWVVIRGPEKVLEDILEFLAKFGFNFAKDVAGAVRDEAKKAYQAGSDWADKKMGGTTGILQEATGTKPGENVLAGGAKTGALYFGMTNPATAPFVATGLAVNAAFNKKTQDNMKSCDKWGKNWSKRMACGWDAFTRGKGYDSIDQKRRCQLSYSEKRPEKPFMLICGNETIFNDGKKEVDIGLIPDGKPPLYYNESDIRSLIHSIFGAVGLDKKRTNSFASKILTDVKKGKTVKL